MRPYVCLCPLTELQIYWSGSIIRQGRWSDLGLSVIIWNQTKTLMLKFGLTLNIARLGREPAVTLLLLFVIEFTWMHYWQWVMEKKSWSCAGLKQLVPAQDQLRISTWSALDQLKPAHDQLRTSLNQLKPAAMLQNIPNQHMLFFFNRVVINNSKSNNTNNTD